MKKSHAGTLGIVLPLSHPSPGTGVHKMFLPVCSHLVSVFLAESPDTMQQKRVIPCELLTHRVYAHSTMLEGRKFLHEMSLAGDWGGGSVGAV